MIFIGSDHAGYKLKQYVKKVLEENKKKYSDEGTYSEDSCDYVFYANEVARQVAADKKKLSRGILICGTGIGMSMAANRKKGIRAALVYDTTGARLSREHNNANILVLSSRTTKASAKKIIETWFKTKFTRAKRHERRIKALDD